jgi:hypothetical protein
MAEVYAVWDRLNLFPEYQREFITFFYSILSGNISSLENRRQREYETGRLHSFFFDKFGSYSSGVIAEIRPEKSCVSIFSLLRKAACVLRKRGIIYLAKKTIRYLKKR